MQSVTTLPYQIGNVCVQTLGSAYSCLCRIRPIRPSTNVDRELEMSMDVTVSRCSEMRLSNLAPFTSHLTPLTTYKSSGTFFENINGFPSTLLSVPQRLEVTPVRWFKSKSRTVADIGLRGQTMPQEATSPPDHTSPLPLFSHLTNHNIFGGAGGAGGRKKEGGGGGDTAAQLKLGKDTNLADSSRNISHLLGEVKSDTERQKLVQGLLEGIRFGSDSSKSSSAPSSFRPGLLTYILIGASCYLIVQLLMKTGNISFLDAMFQEISPENINVSFDDVRGCDEAKDELQDIVEYLRDPDKFTAVGGKLPKGVLLVGEPGTGKTLLARAVACEAGVPFFYAAGSEFDEIFVGMGGKRVRQLFKAAKMAAPSVIFIDEIDSVGGKRRQIEVNGRFANQTINQLLAEMDGFRSNEGVIVLGATNRREDLDIALTRPGRFDVEVVVFKPDLKGRAEILNLYISKIKTNSDVSVDSLARRTVGFTGADLENLVNQAALRAAVVGSDHVTMSHLLEAMDKVMMGPERKSKVPDPEANRITAIHEGGHTIVAYFTPAADPIHKVTIIQRGAALGHTAFIPEKDQVNLTKEQLLAQLDVCMGGRVAEELELGPGRVTTGAASDLAKATQIATLMCRDVGMSDKLGLRRIEEGQRFGSREIGPETQDLLDSEIKRILQESYDRAKSILRQHQKEHRTLVKALLEYETLEITAIDSLLHGKNI